MIQLMPFPVACEGLHRTGWPYVFDGLRALTTLEPSSGTLLFDDFVDRTILYPPPTTVDFSRLPWVGIFHHPPQVPGFWPLDHSTRGLITNKNFLRRRKLLRGVITLSSPLTSFLATRLHVPATTIKYPTLVPPSDSCWNPLHYAQDPTVVHVGWYLRNQDIINQVELPKGVKRLRVQHLSQYSISSLDWMRSRTKSKWHRPLLYDTPVVGPLSDTHYDNLLTKSVILVEFLACAASTTIVEAIARNTPVVVNKIPPVMEYLGKDYPLYYKSVREIPSLLSLPNVLAAHNYLQTMDKSWLSRDSFVASVGAFCKRFV